MVLPLSLSPEPIITRSHVPISRPLALSFLSLAVSLRTYIHLIIGLSRDAHTRAVTLPST